MRGKAMYIARNVQNWEQERPVIAHQECMELGMQESLPDKECPHPVPPTSLCKFLPILQGPSLCLSSFQTFWLHLYALHSHSHHPLFSPPRTENPISQELLGCSTRPTAKLATISHPATRPLTTRWLTHQKLRIGSL